METITESEERQDLTSASDTALLAAFASAHDENAFAMLLRRHGPFVLGVCRRILRNADDADDAFQATFLVLAMRAKKEPPRCLAAWLHRVATRTSLTIKARAARQSLLERMLMQLRRINTVSHPADIDARLVIDEQINLLPKRYREVVVLCLLEGRSKSDAASVLGWAEGTVSSRLHQARTLLRKRLPQLGFGGEDIATSATGANAAVAVPALLATSTLQAAGSILTGSTGAGIVSSSVVMVAKGMAKPMFFNKAIITLAAVVLGIVITVPAVVYRGHRQVLATGGINRPDLTYNAGEESRADLLSNSIAGPSSEIVSAPHPSSGTLVNTAEETRAPADAYKSSRAAPDRGALATRSSVPSRLHTISGQVIDLDGKPVDRAVVFISVTLDNADRRNRERPVVTDAQGYFEFRDCYGDCLLHAFSSNRLMTRSALHVAPGDEIRVQLAPNVAPTISGSVVDTDGNPIHVHRPDGFGKISPESKSLHQNQSGVIVSILVELTPGSGNFRAMQWARDPEMTSDDGRFAFSGFFPDTRFRISIDARGYQRHVSEFLDVVKPGDAVELPPVTLKAQ